MNLKMKIKIDEVEVIVNGVTQSISYKIKMKHGERGEDVSTLTLTEDEFALLKRKINES